MGSDEKQVLRGGRFVLGGVTELGGEVRSNTGRTVVSSSIPLKQIGERDTSATEEDTNFPLMGVNDSVSLSDRSISVNRCFENVDPIMKGERIPIEFRNLNRRQFYTRGGERVLG